MNPAAKVGAFTVGGLMALGATTASLSNIDFSADDNYTIYAGFHQVIGLQPQATVSLSGVPIGKVVDIKNDGGGVTVSMSINKDISIPKDSVVSVASSGVMGDKFINITPSKSTNKLQNGEYLYGVDEAGMDTMFENLNKVIDKVDTLLVNMNNIVGDAQLQKSLVDTANNFNSASEHINSMSETFDRIALNNETNINSMANNLNETLSAMNRTMNTVESITQNLATFAGDPQTVQDLKSTLSNITATSKNIASMAENMNTTFGDKQVADDLKQTIHNAKSISERADKLMTKVDGAASKLSNTSITPSVDVLYSGDNKDWNTNFDVNVANSDVNVKLGVEDIGDSSKLNLTGGKRFKNIGVNAGVINGKAGLGLDFYLGPNAKITAEAFDPNHGSLRLKSQYKIADSTYILAQWHDITDSKDRATYFGLKRDF